MKKRFSLLLFLVFVTISGYSFNQQLFYDPPVINPPVKVIVIQTVQISTITNTPIHKSN